jgi:hypothetical protein
MLSAMNRRELLKSLTAAPFSTMFINKRAAWFTSRIDRKVVLFLDEAVFPLDKAAEMAAFWDKKLSLETTIIPVQVPEGKRIDEVVRVFTQTD